MTNLVGSTDEVHVVLREEFGHYFRSKGEGHAPVVLTPAQHFLVRIRPQEITQQPWGERTSRRRGCDIGTEKSTETNTVLRELHTFSIEQRTWPASLALPRQFYYLFIYLFFTIFTSSVFLV